MTQEQILEKAKEAGFDVAQWAINGGIEVVIYEEGPITEQLERFFHLAFAAGAAHEREVCAKLCEEMWAGGYGPSAITAAIRASEKNK